MATINLGRIQGSVIIVNATQPSQREDGKPLLAGDIWINSSNYWHFICLKNRANCRIL